MNDKLLEELFGSRVKARVLKLFAHNPNLALSMNDITRRVKADRGLCRGAVLRLVKLNILKFHDIKNKKNKNKKKKV